MKLECFEMRGSEIGCMRVMELKRIGFFVAEILRIGSEGFV